MELFQTMTVLWVWVTWNEWRQISLETKKRRGWETRLLGGWTLKPSRVTRRLAVEKRSVGRCWSFAEGDRVSQRLVGKSNEKSECWWHSSMSPRRAEIFASLCGSNALEVFTGKAGGFQKPHPAPEVPGLGKSKHPPFEMAAGKAVPLRASKVSVKTGRYSGKELWGRKIVHHRNEKCGGDGGKFWQKWVDEAFVSGKREHWVPWVWTQGRLGPERIFQHGLWETMTEI